MHKPAAISPTLKVWRGGKALAWKGDQKRFVTEHWSLDISPFFSLSLHLLFFIGLASGSIAQLETMFSFADRNHSATVPSILSQDPIQWCGCVLADVKDTVETNSNALESAYFRSGNDDSSGTAESAFIDTTVSENYGVLTTIQSRRDVVVGSCSLFVVL
jgi:hypothetical protein